MSEIEQISEPTLTIPAVTLGWRLQMALEQGQRSVEYMAATLGVSRSTISRWLHDAGTRRPRRGDMEIFARECGVPVQWLAPGSDDDVMSQPTLAQVSPKLQILAGGGKPSHNNRPMLHSVTTPD